MIKPGGGGRPCEKPPICGKGREEERRRREINRNRGEGKYSWRLRESVTPLATVTKAGER